MFSGSSSGSKFVTESPKLAKMQCFPPGIVTIYVCKVDPLGLV